MFCSMGPAIVKNLGQPKSDNIYWMITLSFITLSGFYSTKILIKSRLITAEALSKFLDDIIDFAFN
jgi:hypothetical protein